MGDDVQIGLEEALEKAHGPAEIRAAYTNVGLSHYARKRYDSAIQCFEAQILYLQRTKPEGDFDAKELEVLGFAYRLLSQLCTELGETDRAAAYHLRCKVVEIDSCLYGLARLHGAESIALPTGKVPSLTALRDQLLLNPTELGPILVQSPKFPYLLNAMMNGGYEVAQQVLQVLLLLLAQPMPRVQRKRLRQILVAVRGLLCTITHTDTYSKVENKLLKMSFVVLRFLVQWIPAAFDCVPLQEVDRFIRRYVPATSSLFSHWSELLLEINTKSKVGSTRSPSSTSSTSTRRCPSFLTDTSTCSSSDNDTLTFLSLPSDDEDLSDHNFASSST
eukprot:GGOE01045221.1.p1 GENE.GGOE01045221.1~~GGOE01045221.1.p1  ORF type:complete len:333 (-),score=113.30 GGOE01045221.1:469-1467(-)